MKIDLNCDLGEGVGNDEAIMPHITSANIACGFHAGDVNVMRETVRLAKRFEVNVGAHPSWNDRENFGRKEMNASPDEVEKLVLEQIQILAVIAKSEGVILTHVKPHGALYNQAAKDIELASAIARAVKSAPKGDAISVDLILVGLAGSRSIEAGRGMGIRVAAEGFPDRGYNADGSLMSRLLPGALIEAPEEVARHAVELIKKGGMDTLCLHGDHPNAAENAKLLRDVLIQNGVEIMGLKK
ncbi:MAG: 5-oxoprolinase subunit PxpA [Anaerolineales bacterium]|nr:5-oxoprolinase subunit PxpA [Anaerolineales bacterium]